MPHLICIPGAYTCIRIFFFEEVNVTISLFGLLEFIIFNYAQKCLTLYAFQGDK